VDLLISLVLGVAVLVVLAILIMSALGVGEQFLDPIVGVLGAPVIRLSQRINTARRERALRKLPPGVPPPPPAP
jgi:hypothetical protein